MKKALQKITAKDVAALLDAALDLRGFASDTSNNGLQVESRGAVAKVYCGVDASIEFIEAAIHDGANMCVVHHGISWGGSLARITDLNYDIVSLLIRNNIALYAAHLPLDAHPSLGNNAQIAARLGLRSLAPFAEYHGHSIGFRGSLQKSMARAKFAELYAGVTGSRHMTRLEFGKASIKTVGVVSGGAGFALDEAIDLGLDALVSGECGLVEYNTAKQRKMNAYFAGHYRSETFGVRALGELLKRKLGVEFRFFDTQIPF